MLPLWDIRSKKFPFWVVVLITINVVVFYLELTVPNPDELINKYSLIPANVNFLNLATLFNFISSLFLHGGFLHIAANLWFLWIFGDNVEERLGYLFFPLFYLFTGVTGNFLQYILAPTVSIPMLGASGAIAGVLGAYYALFPNYKVKTLIFVFFFITIIDVPASFILFYWFIIQLFSGAVAIGSLASDTGGIAYFAHVGGFTAGWIIGRFLSVKSANS